MRATPKTRCLLGEATQLSDQGRMAQMQLIPALRKITSKSWLNEAAWKSKNKSSPSFFSVPVESPEATLTDSAQTKKSSTPITKGSNSTKTSMRFMLQEVFSKDNKDKNHVGDTKLSATDKQSDGEWKQSISEFQKSSTAQLIANQGYTQGPRRSPAAADLNASNSVGAIRVYGDRLPDRENEAYKTVPITFDTTSQEILNQTLRKYSRTEDGKNYALLIVHGLRERYIGLEDRPLRFYRQLQLANENPMLVVRPNRLANRTKLPAQENAFFNRHLPFREPIGC